MLTYLNAHPDEAFDPDEVLILVGAFNKAWQSVLTSGAKFDGNAEAVREILAKHIIDAAQRGELNQRRLSEDALAHLTASLRSAPRSRDEG